MRFALRFLLTLAAVAMVTAGIVGGFYAVENWRGARHWADTQRDLQARGASFDPYHFIPPPIPDDENLAMAPVFVRHYQYRIDPATGLLTFSREGNAHAGQTVDAIPFGDKGGPVSGGPGWEAGQTLRLDKFQQYYATRSDFPRAPAPQSPADDVLLALTRFDPLMEEIAQAVASRPQARFPVNWTQKSAAAIMLPHYNFVQKLVVTVRLRAGTELALGRNDAALRDILLGLHLRRAIAPEPTLIANLVDVTCCGLLMQPIWEGLRDGRWSAAQLAELQAGLNEIDLLSGYRRTVEAELAFIILPLADQLRDARDLDQVFAMLEGADHRTQWPHWMSAMNRLFPRGWYDDAKAVVSQLDQQYVIDPVDVTHRRLDARRIEAGTELVRRMPIRPSTVVAKLCLPVSFSVAIKVARAQTMIDQAVVACALERFHLDHRSYPTDLGALAPALLAQIPTDIIDGAAMRYASIPAGRYRLWTVGWDATDGGGKIVWQKDSLRPDLRQGDWVWQYELVEGLPVLPDNK